MSTATTLDALEILVAHRERKVEEISNAQTILKELGDCNGDHADAAADYTEKVYLCEQVRRLNRVIEAIDLAERQLRKDGKIHCLDCQEELNTWSWISDVARNAIPHHSGCRFGSIHGHKVSRR